MIGILRLTRNQFEFKMIQNAHSTQSRSDIFNPITVVTRKEVEF